MKNKFMKNLILVASLAVFVLSAKSAFAYGYYTEYGYNPSAYNTMNSQNYGNNSVYYDNTNYNNSSYSYTQQPVQQQYVYAQPKVQYVPASTTQVQYVPVETVRYVSATTKTTNTNSNIANTQGASVANATSSRSTYVAANTGVKGNSGQYVNFDPNSQLLGTSGYGVYPDQQVAYDTNGVAALTIGGTGGFMPSSVFQWFLVILLIFAIVIVARMISRTSSKNSAHAPAH